MIEKPVLIYTDGACSGNPGPGGWAAILIYGEHIKELSGYMPHTTNNRMELFAVIQGLMALKRKCTAHVFSDSSYVINAFEKGWINNWLKNGWLTSSKESVENQDLWKALLSLTNRHNVKFIKVKGHANDEYNEKCDKLAKEQITKNKSL